MLNKLRDPIWQSIGVLVTLATIAITIYLTLYVRDTKTLAATVMTMTSLVKVTKGVENKLEISYDGQPVDNLLVLQIRFENTGNQEIREEDYSQPIQITFPDTKLINASIIDPNPSNLGVNTYTESNIVTVSKTLLNPGDAFTVSLLVYSNEVIDNRLALRFKVDSRIAGVKEIIGTNVYKKRPTTTLFTPPQWLLWFTIGLLTSVGIMLVLWTIESNRAKTSIPIGNDEITI